MFATRQIGLNNIADEVRDGGLCVAAHCSMDLSRQERQFYPKTALLKQMSRG
jgi:hypothetical protein